MSTYRNDRNNNAETPSKLEGRVDDILKMGELENLSSLIDDISSYVQLKGKEVNTSQLRNIFSKVLLADEVIEMQLIRPKLMYVAARQTKSDAKKVVEFFEKTVSKIKDKNEVKNFKIFMEAFVAYHKYYAAPKN